MTEQSEFFRRKALTECAICEMVKGLAEESGRGIEINISIDVEIIRSGEQIISKRLSEPQITTKVK